MTAAAADAAPPPASAPPSPSPFDALAASYDDGFSRTSLGQRLRARVWARLDAAFPAGARVLELGCGTGEDALHLASRGVSVVATDASAPMVEATRAKADASGLGARVETRLLSFEQLSLSPALSGSPSPVPGSLPAGPFDGAFSDFGAVNCAGDLAALGRALAGLLRPGAPLLLVVMGPTVPWEWAWGLLHGRPRHAFRRLKPGGVPWRGVTVRYPAPSALAASLSPAFSLRSLSAVGALLPPTEAGAWLGRHPALLERLDRWGSRVEEVLPFPWLSDHYLAELVRSDVRGEAGP